MQFTLMKLGIAGSLTIGNTLVVVAIVTAILLQIEDATMSSEFQEEAGIGCTDEFFGITLEFGEQSEMLRMVRFISVHDVIFVVPLLDADGILACNRFVKCDVRFGNSHVVENMLRVLNPVWLQKIPIILKVLCKKALSRVADQVDGNRGFIVGVHDQHALFVEVVTARQGLQSSPRDPAVVIVGIAEVLHLPPIHDEVAGNAFEDRDVTRSQHWSDLIDSGTAGQQKASRHCLTEVEGVDHGFQKSEHEAEVL